MEIQASTNTASTTVGGKMSVGSATPVGKTAPPSAAELRSAFESMMGSLLGILGAGQPPAVINTPTDTTTTGSNLTLVEGMSGKPLAENAIGASVSDKPALKAVAQKSVSDKLMLEAVTQESVSGKPVLENASARPTRESISNLTMLEGMPDQPLEGTPGRTTADIPNASISAVPISTAPSNGKPVADTLFKPVDGKPLQAIPGQAGQGSPVAHGETQDTIVLPTMVAVQASTIQTKEVIKRPLAEQTAESQTSEQSSGKKWGERVLHGQTGTQSENAAVLVASQKVGVDEKSDQNAPQQPTNQAGNESSTSIAALGVSVHNALPQSVSSTTTAKGDAPILATPTEQINEQVQISLGRGEQDTTIQLNPNELGSVRIRLQMENGQLHLSIRAEQPETGRLLNSKLADLRQSLEAQGIKVGELAVARTERPLTAEAVAREAVPVVRPGQMDMNPNDSHSQRQQTAFTGDNLAGNFSQNQNAQRQQPVMNRNNGSTGDVVRSVDIERVRTTSSGLVAVDYYI